MAGDEIDIKKYSKEILDSIEEFKRSLQNLTLDSIISTFGNASTQIVNSIGKMNNSLRSMELDASKSFQVVASGLGQVLALTSKFGAFKDLSGNFKEGGMAATTMSQQFDILVKRFGSFDAAAKELGKTSPLLRGVLKEGEAHTRQFLAAASSAEHLEKAYLSMQGATGELGKEFADLTNLDSRLAKFNSILVDTAAQSNLTLEQVTGYATKLGQIPGLMDQVVKTGGGTDQHLTSLAASLRLASGAGQSVESVMGAMAIAYENLGNPQGKVTDNADKGAQMFALMSEASQKLNLRFTDAQEYLTNIAKDFKLVGDNTQGATNILGRFSGALQNTGLTAKASVEVIQHMVHAIGKMETGTKALISMRSGGPGGLQGAFQIDNLMRQGKIEDVAKMVEHTLRQQFGGKIYSQAEAGQSQQAAAQFMRQRSMIQSGALGKLAPDAESATRLLEALKAGPMQSAGVIREAMQAVSEKADQGNDLQGRQYTVLNAANNSLDRLVTISEEQFKIDARKAVGTTAEGHYAEGLQRYRRLTAEQATKTTQVREPPGFEESFRRQTVQGTKDLAQFGSAALEGTGMLVMGKIRETINGAKTVASEIQGASADKRARDQFEAEQAKALAATSKGDQMLRGRMGQAMNQRVPNLAVQLPGSSEATKHEFSHKPLEVNIQVTTDPGTKVQTTTNSDNATVRHVNRALNGFDITPRQ